MISMRTSKIILRMRAKNNRYRNVVYSSGSIRGYFSERRRSVMGRIFGRIIGTGLLFLLIMSSAGCGLSDDEKYSSLGVDNEIAGFLFNFDQREVTSRMVNDAKKGKYPVELRWAYGENLKVDEKAPEFVSADPDMIEEVYFALSNTIIMGNSHDHSEETPFYIEMELDSVDTCRYNFTSLSTVRLSSQNYVIESDGSLWRVIREASKKSEASEDSDKPEVSEESEESETPEGSEASEKSETPEESEES